MSITVEHLVKSYGNQLVLDDISFNIGSGEIVGFLGNNGAGKSTTMKVITGYRNFTSGTVKVCGMDILEHPMETRRKIGYLPEHNPNYLDMFVKEYLRFVADLYKVENPAKRVEEMIEKTGLTHEYKKKIGALSKGYRQRVGLAQALIHDPEVLILDEPTTGLDPNQIIEVRNLIKEVGREKSVLLSTHIMQEVSAICDRVIILNKGKIVADEAEKDIVTINNGFGGITIYVEFSEAQSIEKLRMIDENAKVKQVDPNIFLVNAPTDLSEKLFKFAVENHCTIKTMKQQQLSMEDVFRTLTSK